MIEAVTILSDPEFGARLESLVRDHGASLDVRVVSDLPALRRRAAKPAALLLSWSTSVIVPVAVLDAHPGRCFNVHAAPPEYPGRDPHHFAVYDGVRRYGATAHRMTERVDAGEIVGVRRFEVPDAVSPAELLRMANEESLSLWEALMPGLLASPTTVPGVGEHWSGRKTSREDFLRMCRIDPEVDASELRRRRRAFSVPGRRNLVVELHGLEFRLDEARMVAGDGDDRGGVRDE